MINRDLGCGLLEAVAQDSTSMLLAKVLLPPPPIVAVYLFGTFASIALIVVAPRRESIASLSTASLVLLHSNHG